MKLLHKVYVKIAPFLPRLGYETTSQGLCEDCTCHLAIEIDKVGNNDPLIVFLQYVYNSLRRLFKKSMDSEPPPIYGGTFSNILLIRARFFFCAIYRHNLMTWQH
jgi:hypothetical protein